MHMPNDPALQEENEIIFVERREDERAIVGMEGKYALGSWRDSKGNYREFSCRVLNMSSGTIDLVGPVTGSVGDWAIVHFGRLGKFEGPVIRTDERRFTMRIVTTNDDRKKIEGKIAWVKDKKSADKRQHDRFVPRDSLSSMSFSDGRVIPCQIIDYSISGTSVSADINPKFGAILKVGSIIGRVVRQFPEGFAVVFLDLQNFRTIGELFKRPKDKS